jgi:hypothetical protein
MSIKTPLDFAIRVTEVIPHNGINREPTKQELEIIFNELAEGGNVFTIAELAKMTRQTYENVFYTERWLKDTLERNNITYEKN